MTKEEQNYYEAQQEQERLHRERREDVIDERNFWQQVFFALIEDGGIHSIGSAIAKADDAMAAYRERFQ